MLKILQARLQQYLNCELPDVQAGFRKGRGTRDQIANIQWIIEKAREFQKNIDFPGGSDGKASVCNAGDLVSIPGQEDILEKEMAIHSSTIAWKIPWTEEPGRLQSMGSQRVGHNWATSLSLSQHLLHQSTFQFLVLTCLVRFFIIHIKNLLIGIDIL